MWLPINGKKRRKRRVNTREPLDTVFPKSLSLPSPIISLFILLKDKMTQEERDKERERERDDRITGSRVSNSHCGLPLPVLFLSSCKKRNEQDKIE